MGWAENQVRALESRVEYLMRRIEDVYAQLRGAQQTARNAFMTNGPSNPGAAANVPYFATPASSIAANGGTLSGQTIQQYNAGLVTVTTSGTVVNPGPNATTGGKFLYLSKNVDGTYSACGQAC